MSRSATAGFGDGAWPRPITAAASGLLRLDGRMRWRVDVPEGSNEVFLTFDDGPVPEVTPWVLDTLKDLGVKATFFCIGKNIAARPELFERVKAEGHGVGNHTWDHPNGWDALPRAYYRNVLRCQALTGTMLFRPPYGRVTNRQLAALYPRYDVVMWDVLAYDFEDRWTDGDRIAEVVRQVRPGSIIVFHDSVKCAERMRRSMPGSVERLLARGYTFGVLPGGGV
jgi:peptidoglycan/xylan/chitin deacetylase (PgdA/CDA1 family)